MAKTSSWLGVNESFPVFIMAVSLFSFGREKSTLNWTSLCRIFFPLFLWGKQWSTSVKRYFPSCFLFSDSASWRQRPKQMPFGLGCWRFALPSRKMAFIPLPPGTSVALHLWGKKKHRLRLYGTENPFFFFFFLEGSVSATPNLLVWGWTLRSVDKLSTVRRN